MYLIVTLLLGELEHCNKKMSILVPNVKKYSKSSPITIPMYKTLYITLCTYVVRCQ